MDKNRLVFPPVPAMAFAFTFIAVYMYLFPKAMAQVRLYSLDYTFRISYPMFASLTIMFWLKMVSFFCHSQYNFNFIIDCVKPIKRNDT